MAQQYSNSAKGSDSLASHDATERIAKAKRQRVNQALIGCVTQYLHLVGTCETNRQAWLPVCFFTVEHATTYPFFRSVSSQCCVDEYTTLQRRGLEALIDDVQHMRRYLNKVILCLFLFVSLMIFCH